MFPVEVTGWQGKKNTTTHDEGNINGWGITSTKPAKERIPSGNLLHSY
jgi:hypothetical protein